MKLSAYFSFDSVISLYEGRILYLYNLSKFFVLNTVPSMYVISSTGIPDSKDSAIEIMDFSPIPYTSKSAAESKRIDLLILLDQ